MHRRVNEGAVYTAGLDIPSHGQKALFSNLRFKKPAQT